MLPNVRRRPSQPPSRAPSGPSEGLPPHRLGGRLALGQAGRLDALGHLEPLGAEADVCTRQGDVQGHEGRLAADLGLRYLCGNELDARGDLHLLGVGGDVGGEVDQRFCGRHGGEGGGRFGNDREGPAPSALASLARRALGELFVPSAGDALGDAGAASEGGGGGDGGRHGV